MKRLTQSSAFAECKRLGFTPEKMPGGDYRIIRGKSEYHARSLDELVTRAQTLYNTIPLNKKRIAPPEHRFDMMQNQNEFDLAVFDSADYFKTFRLHGGRYRRDTRKFNTFPEALEDAQKDRNAILYVVAKSGRDVVIDEKDRNKYLQLWNKKHKSKQE